MIKRKLKKCLGCGEDKILFSKGLCQYCWSVGYKKPINKSSAKNEARKLLYTPVRNKFLRENPKCLAKLEGCTKEATDVHHKKGREGDLLIDTKFFLPSCRSCHNQIEDGGEWVYEQGFKIKRI